MWSFAMRFPFVALLCALLTLTHSLQAEARFTLQGMMGPGDQDRIGLNKLDPDEQAAFEEWINLWTIKTINQVKAANCKCTTEECLNRMTQSSGLTPQEEQQPLEEESGDVNRPFNRPEPIRRTDPVERVQAKDFNTITEIIRNGGMIRLNNGSTWEVLAKDQSVASRWARFDKVQIGPSDVYSRYTMNNLTRKQKIQVTQPGQPTHSDPYLNDPFRKDLYRQANTYNIRNVLDNGATIILDNGGVYDVKVSQRKIAKEWPAGTAVEIVKKGGVYPLSIKAVITGDVVQIRKKD